MRILDETASKCTLHFLGATLTNSVLLRAILQARPLSTVRVFVTEFGEGESSNGALAVRPEEHLYSGREKGKLHIPHIYRLELRHLQ